MLLKGRKRSGGFTLVELMIVVAIIGILAAVAIPAFSRYVKKSRTAEAVGHLSKLWAGSVTYYESDHITAAGVPLTKQFPGKDDGSGPGTPAVESATQCGCATGGRCVGNSSTWNLGGWVALNFSLADPHNYMPTYTSSGTGASSQFTAQAVGDLDCDTKLAKFTRSGLIDTTTGDVTGGNQPLVDNELE